MKSVGELIGLDGITAVTNNSFFSIDNSQPGNLRVENIFGSHSALPPSMQGVYTCHIPLQSGENKKINIGLYPSGFNSKFIKYLLWTLFQNSKTNSFIPHNFKLSCVGGV